MARLPRKVREINDFNATDWFEKLLQRTTIMKTPFFAEWRFLLQ
jgi:hypothetical protein